MRGLRRRKSSGAEIDISPLIDMVFILLIFFMVSTTFVKDMQLDLERPSAASAERAPEKVLRVNIDRGGLVFLEGQPVKVWMIQSHVRDLLRSSASKTVLVIVDKHVEVDRLIEVVDQCRLAGASDVGVATHREAG